jgi:hypothetical protein
MTFDISKLTIAEVQQIANMTACLNNIGPAIAQPVAQPAGSENESAFVVGEKYLFRTVTHYYTGQLLAIKRDGLVIGTAAWIADTGRFAQAVATGDFKEVEPYPAAAKPIINFNALIDAVAIPKLPTSQK